MKNSTFRNTSFRSILSAAILMAGAFSAFGQKEYSIAEIQGNALKSTHDKEVVRFTGVVTAIVKKAFYVQTQDDKNDKDPKTSDGILVYGDQSAAAVEVGNLVQVDGTVTEFTPKGQEMFFSITEISRPTVKILEKSVPLPAPVVLTPADVSPQGKLDQMERFEGMRVQADLLVVGPTGGYTNEKTGLATSNGAFFAVIQGVPRPFREPGVDVWTKFLNKLPATTPGFDMNPEILRINSQEQVGAKTLDVPAGATMKVTGVVDYFKKFYSILIDAANPPTVENIKGFVPVAAAGPREVTVGSFNIENFFDDEINSSNVEKEAVLPKDVYQTRLKKVSLAIRNVLAMPDILGTIEVENLKVLQAVAAKVNADAVAAGQPDPKYVAYLEEGNDLRGIDVGFLVKSTKIKVIETKQLAKDEKLNFSGDAAPDSKLFDRTPLLLRAEVIDPKSTKPLALTVIVNHLKSFLGVDSDKDGDRVRTKRRLEAEWLANFVIERQKADPNERLILCGDFNAFQFNDGYNDLLGILKGKSDPNVINPSKLATPTGLQNIVEYIDQKSRYSYTFDGSAQAIDHMLFNKPARERLLKFGYARVDADFPLVWSNDASRPERISDHDAAVLFLTLDEPAPVGPAMSPTPKP